jgi:hypothetical protein
MPNQTPDQQNNTQASAAFHTGYKRDREPELSFPAGRAPTRYATPERELERAFLTAELPSAKTAVSAGQTSTHGRSPLSAIRSFGLSSLSGTCRGT